MAAYRGSRIFAGLHKSVFVNSVFPVDVTHSTPIIIQGSFCRCSGTFRNKADQMKDGYRPSDSHPSGKTKDEVIQELLQQNQWPERQKTRSENCKEYAVHGRASGVDPSIMWPTKDELKQLREDESYYCSSLEEMQQELHLEKKRKELEHLRREKHIEKCLADMPRIEEEHRQKEEAKRLQEEASQKKREQLLEVARVKLGYAIDPRTSRFKEMVEEMEKEEKKQKKALKKKGIVA